MLGQECAIKAIEFGIAIRRDGYNVFALGAVSCGKHTILSRLPVENLTPKGTS